VTTVVCTCGADRKGEDQETSKTKRNARQSRKGETRHAREASWRRRKGPMSIERGGTTQSETRIREKCRGIGGRKPTKKDETGLKNYRGGSKNPSVTPTLPKARSQSQMARSKKKRRKVFRNSEGKKKKKQNEGLWGKNNDKNKSE